MKKLTLAQKLRNPATRSKIPTSQLPVRYQKMRAANAQRAQLDDPNALTQPLTPRLLNQQVQSATNLNFGEADRDLQSRQAQAAQTQASIPQWFSDYQAALQHATDTTKAAYAGAAARQQNATDSTYNLDTAAAGQQQQAMQADAATRGATVDPAVAAMAQQAALSRRSAGDIQTGLTSALGAANVSYRGGQQVVGAAQQLVAQRDQANRQGALGQESKDLAAKKGDYAVTTRQKLIDSEHTKQIENKAFDLNKQKAADDVTIKTATLKQKAAADAAKLADTQQYHSDTIAIRRGVDPVTGKKLPKTTSPAAALSAYKLRFLKEHGYLPPTGNPKDKPGLDGITPAERKSRNTAVQQLEDDRQSATDYAMSLVKLLPKLPPVINPSTGKPYPADFIVRRKLTKQFPHASPVVIDFAVTAATAKKNGKPTRAGNAYRKHRSDIQRGLVSK